MKPAHSHVEDLLAHTDWVRRLARSLHGDSPDADDLEQETWLAALERPPEEIHSSRAWLGGVVRNLARMRWRSAARRARREETVAGTRALTPAPDALVARMEMHRLLAEAILRLDEPWRSTVILRHLDGLSSAEIARQEGIPASTVRGRLKDALERLRRDLDDHHGGRRDVWLTALAPLLALSAAEAQTTALAGAVALKGGAKVAIAAGLVITVGVTIALLSARPWATGGNGASFQDRSAPTPASGTAGDPGPGDDRLLDGAPPEEDPQATEQDAGSHEALPPTPMRTIVVSTKDAPAGMVAVPAGEAVIGTTWEHLRNELLRGRPKQIRREFAFEAPQHQVEMAGFFIDRFEVTNAQYHLFMQDTAVTAYNTDEATLANLEEVAGHLIGLPRDRWRHDDVAWRQIYRTNKENLWEKMPGRIVKCTENGVEAVDEDKTEENFHHAPLGRGIVLAFYNRKPPETWPSMDPAPDRLDFPVRSVSYDDAEAFAEWAGKHVPTEQEWEYAARGPQGFRWPWGNVWFADKSHANWGGKNVDEHMNPAPMAVDTLPDGQSWCGAHHMLGNAAEWTSSWFASYPGNEREHHFMGEYVKVIRGATFVDPDPLVLRLAARNYMGAGVKAPPRPGNRFGYVGFRCASYDQPGRDQIGPIMRRVSRGRWITSETVELDRYAGVCATRFAAADEEARDHIYVKGRAHSMVVIPLKAVLEPDHGLPPYHGLPPFRTRKALKKASVESCDPIPLAVFHTDVPLTKVWVRAPKKDDDDRDRRRDAKGKPKPPETVKGDCPAGTYVLGVWHERLCLALPGLEFVCFLTKDTAKTCELDLERIEPGNVPSATIEIDSDTDSAVLGFAVPVGGAGTDGRRTVVVKALVLKPEAGALTAAGTWLTTPSAKNR